MKLSYLTIRSRCDYCRKNITILETIPILSFVFFKRYFKVL
ncbi:prepilin peptidase [Staphylococcus xylosus]|nr:prepilin peptidase [Staphylococcus xylosus]